MLSPPAVPAVPPAAADPVGDLARAWRVWKRHPGLPLGTTVVAICVASGAAEGAVGVVASLVAVVLLGWVGTERLWYLRAWRGDRLRATELLPATLRYFPRFFVLGCCSRSSTSCCAHLRWWLSLTAPSRPPSEQGRRPSMRARWSRRGRPSG